MEKVLVNISWSGDNFCASSEVGGIVAVTAKDFETLKVEFDEAFKFHIEGCIEDGDNIPSYIAENKYEYEYFWEVSALLHKLDGLVTREALAKVSGMNPKQLSHYICGEKKPRPQSRDKILKGIKKLGEEFLSVV